jgi:hypothetical protein
MRTLVGVAALFLSCSSAVAAASTPLFDDEATINIRITGPIRDIAEEAVHSTKPHSATLELVGSGEKALPIELRARGLSRRRRDVCQFPPLRLKFNEKPAATSLFRKQEVLKLVTHCRSSESFQQYTLLEYAAYKMLNVITDASFRVRLANVEYVDSENGKTVAKRVGFFIEDIDDLSKRVGMKEIERPEVKPAQLASQAAASNSLYHYMISNLDWDASYGPPGENCCHNGRVIGPTKTAQAGVIVVPYDFDYSGLVDAPYAAPPDQIKVKSVTTRVWRGFCRHNDEVIAEAGQYLQRKADILAELEQTPGLTAKSKSKAAKYLEGYFKIIGDPKALDNKILKKCRDR